MPSLYRPAKRFRSNRGRVRRTTYQKRTGRKFRSFVSSSYTPTESRRAFKHLAVYKDPFSTATHLPRIPDGKAVTSIGLKNRCVGEITVNGGTNETTDILLYPGLNAWAVVENQADTTIDFNYCGSPQIEASTITLLGSAGSEVLKLDQTSQTKLHRWRMVSAGLHLSLTNNAEENDGWFEAVRFGTPSDAREYLFPFNTFGTFEQATFPYTPFDMSSTDMVNLPSYTSGKLRDIHRYQFNLKPEGNEHDFIKMRDEYTLKFTGNSSGPEVVTLGDAQFAGTSAAAANTAPLGSDTANATVAGFPGDTFAQHDLISSRIDMGYDMVLIRIHGRAGTTTGTSRLKLDTVANHEIIYDERATNARFHQKAEVHPGFDKVRAAMAKRDNRAGEMTKTKTS